MSGLNDHATEETGKIEFTGKPLPLGLSGSDLPGTAEIPSIQENPAARSLRRLLKQEHGFSGMPGGEWEKPVIRISTIPGFLIQRSPAPPALVSVLLTKEKRAKVKFLIGRWVAHTRYRAHWRRGRNSLAEQKGLAQFLGLSQQTVSDLERGLRHMKLTEFILFAAALDTDPQSLMKELTAFLHEKTDTGEAANV